MSRLLLVLTVFAVVAFGHKSMFQVSEEELALLNEEERAAVDLINANLLALSSQAKCKPAPMKCADGSAPNPAYDTTPPTHNGCGPEMKNKFIQNGISTVLNGRFTPCCNNHDHCYGKVGGNRGQCDTAFHTCMTGVCSSLSIASRIVCKGQAQVYYQAVNLGGCTAWANAQVQRGCKKPNPPAKPTTPPLKSEAPTPAKPAAADNNKAAPKPDNKPAAPKPNTKPTAPKPNTKPTTKPNNKPAAKPNNKPAAKPNNKPAAKPNKARAPARKPTNNKARAPARRPTTRPRKPTKARAPARRPTNKRNNRKPRVNRNKAAKKRYVQRR